MRRNLRPLFIFFAVLAIPTLLAAQPGPPPGVPGPPPVPQATVTVDCDAGGSIADALETRATELTIEFTGTCAENLVITRDQLTLRGLDPSATLTDDPSNPAGTVLTIQGGDVVLQGFIVLNAPNRGIRVQRSAGVLVENVTVLGSGNTGLEVEQSSSAHVVDSTFNGNGFAGVAAWGNSNVTLTGELEVSGNGVVGLLLSTGSALQDLGGERIVANDQTFGASVQINATGQFPPLETDGTFVGMVSFGGTWFGPVSATNTVIGVLLLERGLFSGRVDTTSAAIGLDVEQDSTAILDGGTSTAPSALLVLNGVVESFGATFDGNVDLQFNAQARFVASTTTGTVSCDPTALAGGSIVCPASAANSLRIGASEASAAARPALPVSLPFVRPE